MKSPLLSPSRGEGFSEEEDVAGLRKLKKLDLLEGGGLKGLFELDVVLGTIKSCLLEFSLLNVSSGCGLFRGVIVSVISFLGSLFGNLPFPFSCIDLKGEE